MASRVDVVDFLNKVEALLKLVDLGVMDFIEYGTVNGNKAARFKTSQMMIFGSGDGWRRVERQLRLSKGKHFAEEGYLLEWFLKELYRLEPHASQLTGFHYDVSATDAMWVQFGLWLGMSQKRQKEASTSRGQHEPDASNENDAFIDNVAERLRKATRRYYKGEKRPKRTSRHMSRTLKNLILSGKRVLDSIAGCSVSMLPRSHQGVAILLALQNDVPTHSHLVLADLYKEKKKHTNWSSLVSKARCGYYAPFIQQAIEKIEQNV